MKTQQDFFKKYPIPDYESLFNEEAEDIRKTPFKLLSKILSANWPKILLAMLLFTVKASAEWLIPLTTANIINAVSQNDPDTAHIILTNVLFVLFLLATNIPINLLFARYTDVILRNIGAGLRNTVVKKLQHLSISYHKEIESGRLQAKFLRDIEAIETFNNLLLKSIIPCMINVTFYSIIAFTQSKLVTLLFVIIIPVNIILVRFFRNVMKENNFIFRSENEHMSANVSTMLEMIPVTKAHGLENEEIKKLENNIERLKRKGFILDRINAYFGSLSWAANHILRTVCLVFTSVLVLNGRLEIGAIVLFQTYFTAILNNANAIVGAYPELSKGIESVRSVSEIMLSDMVEETKGKQKIARVHGNIEFQNVTYRYPDGDEDIIKNLSLSVRQGECVAFVGASGSGKTTVMNMLTGFLLPTDGVLAIDGKSIANLNLPEYRHHISVVPQSTVLFTGTIKENILYGVQNVSQQKFEQILESANINEFLGELPDGVNTIIGEHGNKLSGGQKQRISIARALIRNPKILILDEATSALDNISELHVQKAINTLIKGRTTFIVAHRLSTIRNADKIIVMDKGKIVETGTYEDLMEKKGHFYELKKLNEIAPGEE